jgi:hypothetical protein
MQKKKKHKKRLDVLWWGLQGHGLICRHGMAWPATDHQVLVPCSTPMPWPYAAPLICVPALGVGGPWSMSMTCCRFTSASLHIGC